MTAPRSAGAMDSRTAFRKATPGTQPPWPPSPESEPAASPSVLAASLIPSALSSHHFRRGAADPDQPVHPGTRPGLAPAADRKLPSAPLTSPIEGKSYRHPQTDAPREHYQRWSGRHGNSCPSVDPVAGPDHSSHQHSNQPTCDGSTEYPCRWCTLRFQLQEAAALVTSSSSHRHQTTEQAHAGADTQPALCVATDGRFRSRPALESLHPGS